jgi:OOP family OmpA-OmpF porin
MVNKGINVRRLSVAGKGFDEPINDNSTDEGRADNRRIEFRVLK